MGTFLSLPRPDSRNGTEPRVVEHPDLIKSLGIEANEIYHVYEDRRGVTWYCTALGVARSKDGSIERLQPYGARADVAFRAYEDDHGTVWIAGGHDLLRATDTGLEVILPNLHARQLVFDHDGDLWVGTNGVGLIKFKNRTVWMLGTGDGLPGGVPKALLAASDGKLWVGSNCGGLSWLDGNRFHTYADRDGLLNSCVSSRSRKIVTKSILVGTYGGGVFRFRDGGFTQISQPMTKGRERRNGHSPRAEWRALDSVQRWTHLAGTGTDPPIYYCGWTIQRPGILCLQGPPRHSLGRDLWRDRSFCSRPPSSL